MIINTTLLMAEEGTVKKEMGSALCTFDRSSPSDDVSNDCPITESYDDNTDHDDTTTEVDTNTPLAGNLQGDYGSRDSTDTSHVTPPSQGSSHDTTDSGHVTTTDQSDTPTNTTDNLHEGPRDSFEHVDTGHVTSDSSHVAASDTPTSLCERDSGRVGDTPISEPSSHQIKKLSKPYFSYHSIENVRYTPDTSYPDHHNEDIIFVLNLSIDQLSVYGVFDGHDGGRVSSLVEQHMYDRFNDPQLINDLRSMDPGKILRGLFLEADSKFFGDIGHIIAEKEDIQSRLPKNISSYEAYMFYPNEVQRLQEIEPEISGGSTAVMSLIIGGNIYVANVGDSRAVLVHRSNNELVSEQLSTDHSVHNEEEQKRLRGLGLDVDLLVKNGRLGTQENTRSIGDYNIKKGYLDVDIISGAKEAPGIAEPSISGPISIDSSTEYLILMSDGVYKSLESLTDPPTADTMPLLLKLIKTAEGKLTDLKDISAHVLEEIKSLHENTYRSNDSQSKLAVQCRKRDDMSLFILYFGQ